MIDAFLRDGRIISIPRCGPDRHAVLEWVVADFDTGTQYSEKMVNLVLGKRYADTAALRRALVDDSWLARDHGVYWRPEPA